MPTLTARPDYATSVRDSFNQQPLMTLFGAELSSIEPGGVEIRLPFRDQLCQQHGYAHAGVITTIVDNACGFAAMTLMPADAGVLTVEFKVNFLNPARADYFLARGRVTKAGRTLSVCQGDVEAVVGEERTVVASMMATMMQIKERR